MHAPVPCLLAFQLADVHWTIPVMGVAVAGLAFFAGRHWAGGRAHRTAHEPPPADPVDVFHQGSPTERRAAPRRKGNNVEVLVAESPDGPPVHGWVADRSVGGLCLLLDQPVPQGTSLFVRPRSGSGAPWTPVEIRSCRADKGQWEVGCRFVKTPQWNVLLLFG
jgi:hypothetical protein